MKVSLDFLDEYPKQRWEDIPAANTNTIALNTCWPKSNHNKTTISLKTNPLEQWILYICNELKTHFNSCELNRPLLFLNMRKNQNATDIISYVYNKFDSEVMISNQIWINALA